MTATETGLRRVSNGFWTGLVLGILVVTGLMAFDVAPKEESVDAPVIVTSTGAADAFIADWDRSLRGTWLTESAYVRTAKGQDTTTLVREARRPPNHIRITGATVDVTVNGGHQVCASTRNVDANGQPSCRDVGTAEDWAMTTVNEVQVLRATVIGATAVYDVANADKAHCYDLYQRPSRKTPAWGNRAKFCFDPVTGAPDRSEYYRPNSTDIITATKITAAVTDQDFVVPAGNDSL